MKDGLREINQLAGVWGSFITNNHGEVLVSLTPPQLKEQVIEAVSSQVIELMVASVDQLKELSEMVFHFSQKKFIVIDLGKAVLGVVCTPSVDLSLLRMTVNVIRTDWDENPKVQTYLEKNNLERV
jgi:predicted regulator of Ras-like GTPase activity (Roadblock/LC7/MglB family)